MLLKRANRKLKSATSEKEKHIYRERKMKNSEKEKHISEKRKIWKRETQIGKGKRNIRKKKNTDRIKKIV